MIHVKLWLGGPTAQITDMTNAGKVGKQCRVLGFRGDNHQGAQETVRKVTFELQSFLIQNFPDCQYSGCFSDREFDEVTGSIRSIVDQARLADPSIQEWALSYYEESIKALNAPRQKLTAGNDSWSGHADESGIHLVALNDPNEWTEITDHRQTNARAYQIASKVWDRVQSAKTISEAANILRNAGAKLHGYCAVD